MSGAVFLTGGKLDSQGLLAADASIQSLITAVNKINAAIGADAATAPTNMIALGIRSTADGKLYEWSGFGVGDSSVTPQVFVSGAAAQGTPGGGAPSAAYRIGAKSASDNLFHDIGIDSGGSINLQSNGTDGSPVPSKTTAVGGTDGSNLQTLSVNSAGAILTQSSGAIGSAAPSVVQTIGGLDTNSQVRAAAVNTSGALAIADASNVPESPLSINGTAFTLGQVGAPSGPMTVNTSSTLLLPDSTGGSAIAGQRGQVEIVNVGNTDISVSPSLATIWGVVWLIRPGGSMVSTYSGPISGISNNTAGGVSVGSPSNLVSVVEWS